VIAITLPCVSSSEVAVAVAVAVAVVSYQYTMPIFLECLPISI